MRSIFSPALLRITMTFLVAFSALALLVAVPALGASQEEFACEGAGGTFAGDTCTFDDTVQLTGENSIVRNVTNILLFVVGVASIIVIIFNGLRLVTSGGDAQAVANARQGIIYGLVGVVVAFMAYAIANFVVTQVTA